MTADDFADYKRSKEFQTRRFDAALVVLAAQIQGNMSNDACLDGDAMDVMLKSSVDCADALIEVWAGRRVPKLEHEDNDE